MKENWAYVLDGVTIWSIGSHRSRTRCIGDAYACDMYVPNETWDAGTYDGQIRDE